MKKYFYTFLLMVSFAAVSSAPAKADRFVVERHADAYGNGGPSFSFNAAQGTAWLTVSLVEDFGGGADLDEPHHGSHRPSRIKHIQAPVAGLSYDAAAAQIVFNGEVGKRICATVTQKHGVFGWKSMINLTGQCHVFTVDQNRTMNVYFEAK